jgi:hypothetical protein
MDRGRPVAANIKTAVEEEHAMDNEYEMDSERIAAALSAFFKAIQRDDGGIYVNDVLVATVGLLGGLASKTKIPVAEIVRLVEYADRYAATVSPPVHAIPNTTDWEAFFRRFSHINVCQPR